jgi:predicted O-linked N-acetylglucosamine transferase (SPINDLY family)
MREPLDQYERITRISQSQVEVLMGVTEFHRACAGTTSTIAAERMGPIAAVTLAVTAVSSVVGMTVIVAPTYWIVLLVLLALMPARSGVVLRWSKRLGLW